ncbi:AIPR family protein [Pseudomonas lalucatii]|nr:AIPR family protein [Pseudomonas lalucatii]
MPPHERVDEAYIGYISADQILEIALSDADSNGDQHIIRSVFYDNVRDFNPESDINKSIITELQSGDNSSFVFKNNGITVVAKEVSRKGDSFTISDFQIVNGCQTTNILASVKDKAKDVMVPFRIIGSSDADFVASIIIGTNKQNEVREDQFWALLPFMKDLEIYCSAQDGDAKILIERRENQYRDVTAERTRVMRTSDLMKVAAAMFFHQPHRAARDHRGIRKEFSDKIFLANHSVELYHAAALALYKFDYLLRTSKIDRSKSIYKFYVLYTISKTIWQHATILSAPPKSQNKFYKEALETILSPEKFISHTEKVSKHIENLILESTPKNREQIRDYIRTDSFADQFSKTFFA